MTLQPLDLFRLDDTISIVTGASSGLGDRFARVLHAVGSTVVVVARRAERLAALVDDLPGSLAIAADLSVADDRERVIAGADCGFGTFAGWEMVAASVVWAKFAALAEGARLASRELWG